MKFTSKTQSVGSLKVSEEVLKTIAKQAAMEVDGVYSLSEMPASLKDYALKARKAQAIKIEIDSDVVKVYIGINLKYGYKIKKVAEQVQKNIKEAVQNMTGIAAAKVNIYVAGVTNIDNLQS